MAVQGVVQKLQRRCERQGQQVPEQALQMLEDAESALQGARRVAVAAEERAAQLQEELEAAGKLSRQLRAELEAAERRIALAEQQRDAAQQLLAEQQRRTAGNCCV